MPRLQPPHGSWRRSTFTPAKPPRKPESLPALFQIRTRPILPSNAGTLHILRKARGPGTRSRGGREFRGAVPATAEAQRYVLQCTGISEPGPPLQGRRRRPSIPISKNGEDGLFLGPPKAQIAGGYFNLPDLNPVTDLKSAEAALQGIIVQGEGARDVSKDSHHGRFLAIQEEYEKILKEDPTFEPARPVMRNPYSILPNDVDDDSGVNLIEDPLSIDISNLFDGCYELLMQMLGRLFAHGQESEDELTQLSDITEELMVDVIGPLGEALTRLPAGPSHSGLTAGPSFRFSRNVNAPPHRNSARALFVERFKELSAYCGFLQTEGSLSAVLTRVRASLGRYAEQLDR